MRWVWRWLSCLLVGSVTRLSQAKPPEKTESFGYLSPGFLLTFAGDKKGSRTALGAELSYMYFRNAEAFGVGAFLQAQSYSGAYGRYAAGFQFGTSLGLELGYAYREAYDGLPAVPAVHCGGFWSLGVLVLGVRLSAPLRAEGARVIGTEGALTLDLKAPIPVHGNDRRFRVSGFYGGG